MSGFVDQRTVLVPDGLAGERVDAAMARMFGFSHTRAADLIAASPASRRSNRSSRTSNVQLSPTWVYSARIMSKRISLTAA